MSGSDIAALLDEQFGAKIKSKSAEAIDPFVVVDPSDLVEVVRFLKTDSRLAFDMLPNMTGVDFLELDAKKVAKCGFEPHLEVVYHFQSFKHRHRFVVKVILPRWKDDKVGELPEVPTLVGLYGAADWHEREAYDLLGINFVGHPNLIRLLLAEDWEGYPLRKDYEFPLEYHGMRGR